jgi:hypothetical protein
MKVAHSLVVMAGFAAAAMAPQALGSVTWPGPDAAGYTGSKTSGNTFTSIKGNGGALVTPADPPAATIDDQFFSITLPFSFSFYGVASNTAFVSSNGQIAFGGTTNTGNALGTQVTASYTNGSFNSATNPVGNTQVDRQTIAPWWDDMQFTSGQAGGLYTKSQVTAGVNEFVIEWSNVAFFNATTNGVTFQAVLRDNGSISFNYLDVINGATGTNGASATIGIHDLGGTNVNNRYLEYSFNTANAVANGDQINIVVPAPGAAALLGLGGLVAVRRRRN